MFAKVKSNNFIDKLKLEFTAVDHSSLKAVLRDENGRVQSSLEQTMPDNHHELVWDGLNHLPYGVYTLELSQGDDQMKMRMIKRI